MVVQGNFKVELIDATTKQPFKEHTSKGKTYAEVEPDAEYFIRITTSYPSTVKAYFEVDGENLGYCKRIPYGSEKIAGLWTREKGKETTTALRFQKASVLDRSASGQPWTGSVRVRVFEAVKTGKVKDKKVDRLNKWSGRSKIGMKIGQQAKKGVKSTVGKTIGNIKEVVAKHKEYKKGRSLGTIDLHYCTALGLIYADVLPKPPRWDLHRMNFPRKPEEKSRDKEIRATYLSGKPEEKSRDNEIRSTALPQEVLSAEIHVEERRFEVFDLT